MLLRKVRCDTGASTRRPEGARFKSLIHFRALISLPWCGQNGLQRQQFLGCATTRTVPSHRPDKSNTLAPAESVRPRKTKIDDVVQATASVPIKSKPEAATATSNLPAVSKSGKRVRRETLADPKHDAIAELWHPTKNAGKTPADFTAGSAKRVWLQCDRKHDFDGEVRRLAASRMPVTCPVCVLNLAGASPSPPRPCNNTVDPIGACGNTAAERGAKKTDGPSVTLGKPTTTVYRQSCSAGLGHPDFDVSPAQSLSKQLGCPLCQNAAKAVDSAKVPAKLAKAARPAKPIKSGRTSFLDVRPDLRLEWDPTNERAPHRLSKESRIIATWKCLKCQHKYDMSVRNKVGGQACPSCGFSQ